MKSLKAQIEFIDKKLLSLYGFTKGVIDYMHTICISEPDANNPVDLIKLNNLIPEFRKIFHAKNFSLHKTQYKIISNSQAICLLKTCLEITSIPFDIFLKSKKKYLRLISKNNILDDYINTLKMSENGTLEEKNNSIGCRVELEMDKHETQKLETQKLETQKLETQKSSENYTIGRYILEEGLKEHKKIKLVTKEQLNQNIKKVTKFEYFLLPKKLLVLQNIDTQSVQIDMKDYGLIDKMLKSYCVKIISKTLDGEPVISEPFVKHIVSNMRWEFSIGGNNIWWGNFVNGQNIIISDAIILNNCLQHHDVHLKLLNIDLIRNMLDNLEIQINGEYVGLYNDLEAELAGSMIEQEISIDDKYNLLTIMHGMAGNGFNEFIPLERFKKLRSGCWDYSDLCANNKNILKSKEDIRQEKSFEGKPVCISNIEGFEITNILFEKNNDECASVVLDYGYDFVCWNKCCPIQNDIIGYHRIMVKNKYIHCYKINISGNFDSISRLEIMLPGTKKYLGSNIKINYYHVFKGKLNYFTNYTLVDEVIKINLEPKHLLSYGQISHIILSFETDNVDEPIMDKIIVLMKVFKWLKNFIKKFVTSEECEVDIEKLKI